jgi:hypothetical protein
MRRSVGVLESAPNTLLNQIAVVRRNEEDQDFKGVSLKMLSLRSYRKDFRTTLQKFFDFNSVNHFDPIFAC